MPINQFLPVAVNGTPNVVSQSAYAASAPAGAGYVTGIVPSALLNKSLRQASLIAQLVGAFINAQSGQDALDDGTITVLLANMLTSIGNTVVSVYAGNPNTHVAGKAGSPGVNAPSIIWDTVDRIFWVCITTGNAAGAVWLANGATMGTTYAGTSTGTANAQVLTPAVPIPAYEAGRTISFVAGFTNNAALTLNASGLGPRAVVKDGPTGPIALAGGEVVASNLVTVKDDGTRFHLVATELGTAALANASSNTGTVSAVTGAVAAGHLAVFSDILGTLQDGGLPGVAAAPTLLTHANNGQVLGPGVYSADPSAASGGPFSIKLPAIPTDGQSLEFQDALLLWSSTNVFTVDGNGRTITAPLGTDTTVGCVSQGLFFKVQWSAALNTWRMS